VRGVVNEMPINDRKEGDFILDLRINQVGKEKREKMVYIGDKKLAIRQKIPTGKVERVFQTLKSRFNEIKDSVEKLEENENV